VSLITRHNPVRPTVSATVSATSSARRGPCSQAMPSDTTSNTRASRAASLLLCHERAILGSRHPFQSCQPRGSRDIDRTRALVPHPRQASSKAGPLLGSAIHRIHPAAIPSQANADLSVHRTSYYFSNRANPALDKQRASNILTAKPVAKQKKSFPLSPQDTAPAWVSSKRQWVAVSAARNKLSVFSGPAANPIYPLCREKGRLHPA